ncbi:general substrate transporter, partial [Coemansia spiralis]
KVNSLALGITKYQLFCVLAASLPSISYGWNLVVTNLPGDIIIKCLAGQKHNINGLPSCIPSTDTVWGAAVGSYALGALIGAISCTWFSNRYGRRFVLIYSNFIGIAATVLMALPVNIAMVVVGRVIAGIAQGAANGTFSSYTVEIASPRARNSLACMTQMAVSIGIMLALVVSLGMLKPPLWRVLFSLTSFFCLLSVILLHFCVESPKWLAMQSKSDKAQIALQRLRQGADVTDEFKQVIEATQRGTGLDANYTASVADVVLGKTPENLRHQLLVAVMIMFFQQASGISAVSFYSTTLFNTISTPTGKVDVSKPTFSQILSAVLILVATVVNIIAVVVANYLGRRTLMLTSHALMAIFSVFISVGSVLSIPSLAITGVFLYFSVFFFGPGPLPWVVPNEMTPTYAISAVMALNNSVGYLGIFVVGLIFSPIVSVMHGYTFLLFAGLNALAFVFFFFFLPETKDRLVTDMVK